MALYTKTEMFKHFCHMRPRQSQYVGHIKNAFFKNAVVRFHQCPILLM